ncbi:MAG TPA: NUDIX domain-containing protein [Dehalococcoidia bacterium]|nr:NUDIX domain-containing protein [Dehalococcoidia bacterium]
MCPPDDFIGEQTAYIPEAPGRGRVFTEKKFPDETLASWEATDLPEDATVVHVTMYPYRGERVVLTWREGRLLLPEGDVKQGESAEEAVRRIALEQCGITDLEMTHLGHFKCRATVHSKLLPAGTITYRALYGVDVSALADFPAAPGHERRIVMQRDLLALVRDRYFEHWKEYLEALDQFVLARAKRAMAAPN